MKTDITLSKPPPQAIEYEQAILAACLFDRDSALEVLESLSLVHFYRSAHQHIFAAMQSLGVGGEPIDVVTLAERLKKNGHIEEIGGAAYLSSLMDVPLAVNVEHYCKVVREKATLRSLIVKANDIMKAAYSETADTGKIVDSAQQNILSVSVDDLKESQTFSELVYEASDRYEYLKAEGRMSGVRTGFFQYDLLTGGLQKSDLIIIAARPSMGKTSLAWNMTLNIAKEAVPIAWFSLEMSKAQLIDRAISSETGINTARFRDGNFNTPDWAKINAAQSRIHSWPIFIDDSDGVSVSEIRRRTRRLHKRHGIKIVFVDHLQLIRGDDQRSRDREIGSITAGLKGMAKELQIPVVLLCQLNREVEKRNNKRPKLADLRDSGNIEQDADIVSFIYRRPVYNDWEDFEAGGIKYALKPGVENKDAWRAFYGSAELNTAKQRNGPTGMLPLWWESRQTRFSDIQKTN